MKIEIRVFRHDKAAPIHVEEFGAEDTFNLAEIAHENKLGRPLRPTEDGELYENGEIKIVPVGKA